MKVINTYIVVDQYTKQVNFIYQCEENIWFQYYRLSPSGCVVFGIIEEEKALTLIRLMK